MNFEDAQERNYELLEKQDLPFTITQGEWKATKNGGEYLSLTFTVIGEKNARRNVWLNYNFFNANSQAVAIAKGEYLALAKVFGFTKEALKESTKESLIGNVLGKQVIAEVFVKEGSNGYPDSNSLRKFKEYTTDTDHGDVPF